MITKNVISSVIVAATLVAATATYANDPSRQSVGFAPISDGVATGYFNHDPNKPFRVTDTYGDGTFVVGVRLDSNFYQYDYWLRLTEKKPVDYVVFSSHGTGKHVLNQCLVTFTLISPTQAKIEISDLSERGCSVDHNGSISFNYLSGDPVVEKICEIN